MLPAVRTSLRQIRLRVRFATPTKECIWQVRLDEHALYACNSNGEVHGRGSNAVPQQLRKLASGGAQQSDTCVFAWGVAPAGPAHSKEASMDSDRLVVMDLLGNAPEWQERALCSQTDPEAFFPEKGGSTREAKQICSSCEVRSECLEYALLHDERFGIWGGLSERERRRIKRRAG